MLRDRRLATDPVFVCWALQQDIILYVMHFWPIKPNVLDLLSWLSTESTEFGGTLLII